MSRAQFMRKLSFIVLFLCMTQALWAESDHDILYDWQNYTYKGAGRITHTQQHIIISSNSGIIFIDKQTSEQTILNRVSGLTDNHLCFVKMINDELWYGGLRNGFGVIKDGKIYNFTRSEYPLNHTASVNAIDKDRTGCLYVSSGDVLLKIKDNKCIEEYPFPQDPFSSDSQITAIYADENGEIWVGGYDTTGNEGIGILADEGIKLLYKKLGRVKKIIKAPDGSLWMLAKYGLLKYDGTTFHEILTETDGQEFYNMSDMAIARDGKIWLVSSKLLMSFDGENITKYQYDSEYPNPLGYIDIDGDDIYVTALISKFLRFKNGTFETISLNFGQLVGENMSKSGSIDHDGNYLAGTMNSGLLKFKPDGTYAKLDFFKDSYISKTTSDQNGDIWVACNWASPFRLYKITPSDTITYNTDNSSPLKGGEEIFQMAVDHQNRLWIASSNGLHCFNGSNWQTFNKDNSGLTTNRVYCVTFDKEGRLWTSCGNNKADYLEIGDGLFCYDGKAWLHYVSEYEDVSGFANKDNTLKMPIRTNSIGYIAIDDNNTFWMAVNYNDVYYTTDVDACHGGVIRWDGKDDWQQFMSPYNGEADPSAATYTTGEWIKHIDFVLPGNWVNSIELDRFGRVWLGFEGDHGIAMYDGKDFTVWDMDMPGIAFGNIYNISIDKVHDRIWVSHPWGASGGAVSTALIRHDSTNGIHPQISPSLHHQQTSTNVYDLSGRQILQPKRGELFIKDRKKYIKR